MCRKKIDKLIKSFGQKKLMTFLKFYAFASVSKALGTSLSHHGNAVLLVGIPAAISSVIKVSRALFLEFVTGI